MTDACFGGASVLRDLCFSGFHIFTAVLVQCFLKALIELNLSAQFCFLIFHSHVAKCMQPSVETLFIDHSEETSS